MNRRANDPWTERLSEYLDGDLGASEREACESHLAGCAECARVLEELKAVVTRAGDLPAPPPPADLWAGIEARLETPVLRMRPRAALRERWTRRWSLSGLQLAGAAAALVAITAGVTWLASPKAPGLPGTPSAGRELAAVPGDAGAIRSGDSSVTRSGDAGERSLADLGVAPGSGDADDAPRERSPQASATLASLDPDRRAPQAAADFGIGRYDAAIAELEAALDAKRARLNPETVRIVEANLAIVDKAIDEARSALAADPASRYLNAHLAGTMRRKVDLLRRLNSLARV